MFVRAYLRASTNDQNADRARVALENFAKDRGQKIAAFYAENESGARLDRPELFRLINDSHEGDVLLCEQVDRLSRLKTDDWERLKSTLTSKRIRVVALDLPTSHELIRTGDEFTTRMLEAVNGMMLDMLAAISRKDYTDRRRRQAEGIATAKTAGLYKGRAANVDRNREIVALIDSGKTWSEVMRTMGCSRSTISRLLNERQAAPSRAQLN